MDSILCGAKTRSGRPCRNIPFADNGRCKFHGGLSTGPKDKTKLYGNKNAVGNRGGGAPKGNKNAAKKKLVIYERTIPLGKSFGTLIITYAMVNGEEKEIDRKRVN